MGVGLPDVIAHGMFTMAEAVRVVTDWAGDPAAVVEYGVRFTKPVVVPNDDQGAVIQVSAKVAAKLDDQQVRVDLVAMCSRPEGPGHVPGRGQARVATPVVRRPIARRGVAAESGRPDLPLTKLVIEY